MTHLEIGQSTRVERCRVVRLNEKGLVAVFQGGLQLADDRTGPAPSVPHRFQAWVEPDRAVIVADRAPIIVPLLVCFRAIGESPGVVGTEFDGLAEILDRAVIVALLLVCDTAVVERFRKGRI